MTAPEQTLPHGSWPTPITSELVVRAAARLGEVVVDGSGDDADVWWAEGRPSEGGRTALVRRTPDGTTTDLLPSPWNARTRVHEYGGGAWTVATGTVWFTDFADQRLYRVDPGSSEPVAVTPEPAVPAGVRHADLQATADGAVLAVRETHGASGVATDVVNEVVRVERDGTTTVLVTGPDFVSDPRLSPDGRSLAWLQWQHPDMPWDAAELIVRGADGGETVVAGGRSGAQPESIVQPTWGADGALWFLADRTDVWSLYRWTPGAPPELVVDTGTDIAGPQWVFGQRRFALLRDGRAVLAYGRDGADRLAVREPDGTLRELPLDQAAFGQLAAAGGSLVCVAGGPASEPVVLRMDVDDATATVLRPARDLGLDPAWFSRPQHVTFPTEPGPSGVAEAHALVYPPTNPQVTGPDDELPPLLVLVHGGPTAAARSVLDLGVQYWTSRGFAVADVDYRGSTGYGRRYREALKGQWGVADLDDVVACARYLSSGDGPAGLRVDPARLAIRGGSAGGYTTLAALTFRPGVFAAGASHYGVADLAALAADTHKFESRYLDGLIAPWPAGAGVYAERSPINATDALDTPLAVFQGDEDRVVPPEQAEMMVAALRAKGVPHAYVLFPGEQHGFRKAENIRTALDGELSFYAQVLGFSLPAEEGITPIEVVRP
ncbi:MULTISPECIES: S9 family peptidase [unclassified Modestobacter]|uniref:S9 family peptidase n=1 Tax=unclassified Modestobacter TaxID=2643866 RepID=UPI0022A9F904|nr:MULTISPECIES: S9 family peptidase [unclassified Modestobacter]MCZ2826839.1 S9 family peptidase [Modestobacter sp. VKM Ac-2981]MCZ2855219.1 S9 family peptidase [Modestobacter sp. VKM Ac-2982]